MAIKAKPAAAEVRLDNLTILLVITGGVAGYKSLELARLLRQKGAKVLGVISQAGLQFVTTLSLSALTEQPVYSDLFASDEGVTMAHIRLVRLADMIIVAPASANFMARVAGGQADDLAAALFLTLANKDNNKGNWSIPTIPVVFAPAMNPYMWQHTKTQQHVAELRQRGFDILEPMSGETACGEVGFGRMWQPTEIVNYVLASVALKKSKGKMFGKKILMTLGATREKLDRVRYLSNFSSGRQGLAILQQAANLGAEVTAVVGQVERELLEQTKSQLKGYSGIKWLYAETAQAMFQLVEQAITNDKYDVFIGVAAVSDFRAKEIISGKIQKADLNKNQQARVDASADIGVGEFILRLVLNPDIIQAVAQGFGNKAQRPNQVVGFAAEVDVHLEESRQKIINKYQQKNCDLLLVNEIQEKGEPFQSTETNIRCYQWRDGKLHSEDWGELPKTTAAKLLLEKLLK